ncbi:MAG: hypothetical protein PHP70_11720 [Gallionella sp.]|nr:hypothetical protein [Gallionella sp.]
MFGVVNAFFSACAFAGIIFTILLQRDELELQRMELNLTRIELQRSASAQEKSEYALSRQANAADLTARLSAINNILQYISAEIEMIDKQLSNGINRDINIRKRPVLEGRRQQLVTHLDIVFDQVIKHDESMS